MTTSTLRPRCGLLFLAAGLALAGCGGDAPVAAAPPAPPKVTVAHAEQRELADFNEFNGWLAPVAQVEVRSRVRGHIAKVHFTDGQIVQQGAPLISLDKRPFEAEHARAQAELQVYEAQKVAAEKDAARLKELVVKGGASQKQVEKAEADVLSLDAQIAAAKQEIENRRLDLEYADITAAIPGRLGRALLDVGNLVNATGTDLLTTIVSIDPIQFYFNVDERALQNYVKSRRAMDPEAVNKQFKDLKVEATFGLDTDQGFPNKGFLDFADNRVDRGTGTIQVRGTASNAERRLVPGSRVRVRVPTSLPYKALVVPDTAVLTDQDRKYLLVVTEAGVVVRRDIKPGRLLDDGGRVVLPVPGAKEGEGVQATDWVIVLGLQRARVNYPVEALDANAKQVVAPGRDARPRPGRRAGEGA